LSKLPSKIRELIASAEARFGAKVLQVTAPGGKSRDSLRLHFADRTIIATKRSSAGRGRHEIRILTQIGRECGAVPSLLGQSGEWYFQQDAGTLRLSQASQSASDKGLDALARKAIVAIFEVQRAANDAGLVAEMPRLGATQIWIAAVIDKPAELAATLKLPPPVLDKTSLLAALDPPNACFVKWDCRAGNAALDAEGHLRWFDFEYAGQRHGAEDFAWLIGDEIWPLPAARMFNLIVEIGPHFGAGDADYMSYLALYTSFHIVQRLALIHSEVLSRGWLGMDRILRKDDVGATPTLAMRLCDNGAWCAARHPLAHSMVPFFQSVRAAFAATLPPTDGPE